MRFKFDDIVVDDDRRLVTRAGEEVRVPPKAFELLLALLSRAPNAMSKAELLATVWPDTHVSEATLKSVVADVREALGDDARVRTLNRFGYAFDGNLECDVTASAEPVRGWLVADSWRFPLRSGETILGRAGTGVVPLPSPSVSRQHASVFIEGAAARLQDLGSKNGTFVDDARVERPIALRDGARLRFGTLEMVYRLNDDVTSTDTV